MKQNDSIYKEILSRSGRLAGEQVKWRRHLHRHPETAFEEIKTTAYLRGIVRKLGLKVLPIKIKTGLLAEIRGKKAGPTIAIRTDIDALPIGEESGLSFASTIPNRMHACGHDMHMATVLGVAAVLAAMKEELAGTVRFIFQPAEEKPPGGARPMIENGALRGVKMILGLHVDPRVATGRIGLRDGIAMAAVLDFDLIIHGRSGHAARPQAAVDAVVTAAEVVGSLQKVISREIDPVSPVVITFGKIEGGTARNVIADRVTLTGTARALSDTARKDLPRLIKRTARAVCRARGARAEIRLIADYPPLKNHVTANRLLARNYRRLYGKTGIVETELILGGEDFACYLEQVPGAMFRLGIKNRKIGADKSWHSSKFIADEAALPVGTSLLAAAAFDFLQESSG